MVLSFPDITYNYEDSWINEDVLLLIYKYTFLPVTRSINKYNDHDILNKSAIYYSCWE